MGKVYVTRCIVKRNGKQYKRGSVIEDLTPEEIKQGLAQHWLGAVGYEDDGEESGLGNKPASKRDRLLAKAKELGIEVEDSITNADLDQKIKDVVVREKLISRANELEIEVKDEMTNNEIRKLIKEAKV
jgi:hypothetical protein